VIVTVNSTIRMLRRHRRIVLDLLEAGLNVISEIMRYAGRSVHRG
jgi:hypothetical protein